MAVSRPFEFDRVKKFKGMSLFGTLYIHNLDDIKHQTRPRFNPVGESRVSWATFCNILSGVFPVEHVMVGIVLKQGYITYLSNINEQLNKKYGYTTDSAWSGSTNPSYGVDCATQGGRLINYSKNSQLTNVHADMGFFFLRKCKNKT